MQEIYLLFYFLIFFDNYHRKNLSTF